MLRGRERGCNPKRRCITACLQKCSCRDQAQTLAVHSTVLCWHAQRVGIRASPRGLRGGSCIRRLFLIHRITVEASATTHR